MIWAFRRCRAANNDSAPKHSLTRIAQNSCARGPLMEKLKIGSEVRRDAGPGAKSFGYHAHCTGSVGNVEQLAFGKAIAERRHQERSVVANRGFDGFDQEIQALLVGHGGKLCGDNRIRMYEDHTAGLDADRKQSVGDVGWSDGRSVHASRVSHLLQIS